MDNGKILTVIFKPTLFKLVMVLATGVIVYVVGKYGAPIRCELEGLYDVGRCPQMPLAFLYPWLYKVPTMPAYIIFEGYYDLIRSAGMVLNVIIWYVLAGGIEWAWLAFRGRKGANA